MSLKKIFLLTGLILGISLSLMAQTKNDYETAWKKVGAFDEKGLPKSALAEVLKIYQQALKDNNMGQQVKAAMYQVKYRNQVEEDSRENNIFFIDTLISKAKAPAKNILQSMQAEMFWSYAQQNRWKLYSRTQLAEEKSNDITTWSLQKLNATISKLYRASLQPENGLKQTKLESFDDIINKGKNSRNLRPTLYDFLAHRALVYFTNDEKDVTKPAYQFTINHPESFAPAATFVKIDFKQADTAASQYQALKIFQALLAFHLDDVQPDALIDADLARLQFINNYGIFTDKEKRYEAALKAIETKYPSNPLTAEAMYRRAQVYVQRGQAYAPFGNNNNQYEIKRAKELLDSAYSRFPKSEGGINAKNFSNNLLVPSLNIETEKVNVPGQPFRSLVKYKNVNRLYFRIIKTTREDIKKIDRTAYEKLWATYTALKPTKAWSQDIPDLKDLQQHAAEIKIDALPIGTYYLLASINADFSLSNNIIAKQVIQVSNISYINNNRDEYYVLHRDNGSPLPNTQVQLWESKYDYKTSNYNDTRLEKYTTDKNGYFKIKNSKESRNYKLQFTLPNDELFPDEYGYRTYYNSYETPVKPQSFLFSDRSIYRPGQTIFFKGIVLKRENIASKSTLMPGYKTKLILRDANSQKVGELDVTTNDFGSYKGSFKLPAGGLTGAFSLLDESTGSIHSFRVEEYKRPKFIVEIEKPKGTYRVNDSITVTGNAKAYAGNNIDGAKVSYRVVRQVRYPIWWEWGYLRKGRSIFPPRNTDAVEIANGITTTDGDGQFKVTFKALPDEEVDKTSQPTFYYEVSADITDINGETRSAETSVAVAYQSLQLNINGAASIPVDSLKYLLVSSTNLNDIFEKAKVEVSIYKVEQPNKIFRQRFWERPDQFVMSKEEYYSLFPYDVYDNEDQFAAWPVGEKLLGKTDTTSENQQFPLGNNKLKAGWYKIVATTKDKYGELVNAEKYIQLTDESGVIKEPVRVEVKKTMAEPGEKMNYSIRTGFDKIWMIHTLSKMPKSDSTTYLPLTAPVPFRNEIAVTENDRGGIALSYAFVQHNRVYNSSQFFNIPWSNKELQVKYETFRDKLLPGSKEKWKVKITGNKGEKVSAEVLAGMYDASLDQYGPHNWSRLNIWPGLYNTISWTHNTFTYINSEEYNNRKENYLTAPEKSYDQLLAVYQGNYYDMYRYSNAKSVRSRGENEMAAAPAPVAQMDMSANLSEIVVAGTLGAKRKSEFKEEDRRSISDTMMFNTKENNNTNENVQVRKNFNETAFFYPELMTDAEGNVEFSFTIPEALTSWKLMTFAHTKDLSSGYDQQTTVTQKPLMVQPNAPRFMREGDKMEFSAKIVNLSDKEVTGTVQLELLDAATNKPVDGWFKNVFPSQYFTVAAGKSEAVKFPMEIPFNFASAMSYRIVAKTTEFSDGEEMAIPILTNRMLVTETLPLNMRNANNKTFRFEKLLNSGNSNSIGQHALTVEYTSNPAWYAVQALPYLMEYPYECAEQTFNRYYANALASSISNSIPKIKAVFEKWSTLDTTALQSNLEKNPELKSALLEETPWVMAAQNENQQKKHIAELFNLVKLGEEMNKAFNKLKEMQGSNGGFTWFKGGPDDRYMTQYISTGIGHLRKLNALSGDNFYKLKPMLDKALPYLDKKIKEDYDFLVKQKIKLADNHLSYFAIQYLYMRSFYKDYEVAAASKTAVTYYTGQAKKYWLSQSKYMQAMIALALHRDADKVTPAAIIRSLKENSITHEELGMYWKEWTTGGYYWHQAPIESQALMIEAFTDIDQKTATIDDLKTWLLKQKQTQNWRTTKATAEACYALLLGGSNWLAEEKTVTISLGNTVVKSTDTGAEAGTGYFKKRFDAAQVKPAMGTINVAVQSNAANSSSTSWGAAYWQYFEDLDKITTAATPLQLTKKLFVEKNSPTGPILVALTDGATLKVGDKVKVRIELKADRDMEYLHLKDMRAACMEPVNVLSQYKWQGGLGYYESTKDASTNFFISWLPRGSYVFEYPVFVTHAGNFSNGISSIQCMYAPEFSSHSEGIRVTVE